MNLIAVETEKLILSKSFDELLSKVETLEKEAVVPVT